MILAATQTKDDFIVGIIFVAISIIWFIVGILFWPSSQKQVRWGKGGGGAPVSRLGFLAWGLAFGIIGLAAMLHGYGVLSGSLVMVMLVAGFIVLAAAGFYDTYKHRR